ncbi:MAG: ThuA domain-containing protein [Phycisphaerales bacterium]|nr:MAG: ThuA domain-containing protein [Phycisphaerales bacterium]
MVKSSAFLGIAALLAVLALTGDMQAADDQWIQFEGSGGPGQDRHIVFVTGDEEYRSEESMPLLAKILAVHHGFKCTVLFAIDPDSGEINPLVVDNIPGLEVLRDADLMVLFTRFRELPDAQMKHIIDYTNSGKPIVALRTATHPFFYKKNVGSPYAKYTWNNKSADFKGGYGRQVLGETWVNHHGHHQKESTRGLIADGMQDHPMVRGVGEIWGPSDVYGLTTLNGACRPIIIGHVLKGMNPDDDINTEKKALPVAWTKTYTGDRGKTSTVFTTTMGHAGDLKDPDFRRLMVNACYWCVGLGEKVPASSKVDIIGTYDPKPIGFGGFRKGVKPADHKLPAQP